VSRLNGFHPLSRKVMTIGVTPWPPHCFNATPGPDHRSAELKRLVIRHNSKDGPSRSMTMPHTAVPRAARARDTAERPRHQAVHFGRSMRDVHWRGFHPEPWRLAGPGD
jgi:hypothetical protein